MNARGHSLPAPWVDFVVDRRVLDEVLRLLASFYETGRPADEDVRLRLKGDRLGNGGEFAALKTVRRRLADGFLDEGSIDELREVLARLQAEMRRFTDHLRIRLASAIKCERVTS